MKTQDVWLFFFHVLLYSCEIQKKITRRNWSFYLNVLINFNVQQTPVCLLTCNTLWEAQLWKETLHHHKQNLKFVLRGEKPGMLRENMQTLHRRELRILWCESSNQSSLDFTNRITNGLSNEDVLFHVLSQVSGVFNSWKRLAFL